MQQYLKQYPQFQKKDIDDFFAQFQTFDLDGNGSIDAMELEQILKNLGETATPRVVRGLIDEVDDDRSGTIEFDEFLHIISKIRKGESSASKGFGQVYTAQVKVTKIESKTGGLHSFADEEKEAFSDHINMALKGDKDVSHLIPIDPESMDLFDRVKDGVVLAKLINHSVPKTIDERVLNLGQKINPFQVSENQDLVINSAKAIGCNVVNIGAKDLEVGTNHLVLGLIWQIVKIGLFQNVTLENHPGLVRLLEEGESIADLMKLSPDKILLRWINFHLKEAGSDRRVANFSGDIKDSEAYTILLHQIAPKSKGVNMDAMNENDLMKRAEIMLQQAEKLDARKYVRPMNVVKGNTKLNLAFVGALFNAWPALEPLEEEEMEEIVEELPFETREEKMFRIWINAFGFQPQVNLLYEDLKDGLVLLKIFDRISPGIVDWSKVNRDPRMNKFKKVENCNYAILLGKQLKFSLVGIAGSDIVDGNKTLVLALVWQMMRFHSLSLLRSLSKTGKEITDSEIIQWANKKVIDAGKTTKMGGFKDSSLSNGLFLCDLLYAVAPEQIRPDLLSDAGTPEENLSNCEYVISAARKIGCTVFALPLDIAEVKPKAIMLLVAAIMVKDTQK